MLNAPTGKSEDDFGGRPRPMPGKYHAVVSAAEEKGSKRKGTPGLELEFQVIFDGLAPDGKSHTTGQAGKTIPLFLSYISEKGDDATKTCIDRVTRLALSCGVLRAGESKEVDWNEAIGRELVIEIEPGDEYTDDKGNKRPGNPQISFSGFWSLGNKAVVNVPKDPSSPGMQALAKGGHAPQPAKQASTAASGNGGTAAAASGGRKPSLADL
jgi:hypothetical protein